MASAETPAAAPRVRAPNVLVLIFGILAISLNLLLGFAGQVSVAHAAFAARKGLGWTRLGLCLGRLRVDAEPDSV